MTTLASHPPVPRRMRPTVETGGTLFADLEALRQRNAGTMCRLRETERLGMFCTLTSRPPKAMLDPGLRETALPKSQDPSPAIHASGLINAKIESLGDWRGELLARLRALIQQADPEVSEDWKWDTPVWSCDGILRTGEVYKKAVKMTFAKGASLPDPGSLFSSSLKGKVRRAIDFPQGAPVDETALTALLRAAIAANRAAARRSPLAARPRPVQG